MTIVEKIRTVAGDVAPATHRRPWDEQTTHAEEARPSRLRVDVVEGLAPAVIGDFALEHEVRIVVVGRESPGALDQRLHGEHVMEIIRRSSCPVLVVPTKPILPIERAMVVFDFSTASIRAAATAHGMIGPGGRLTLVHVATPHRVTDERSQWWLRSAERRARETLRDFAGALPRRAGVAVDTEQIRGRPVDGLIAYARSNGMDLLACGWHEHGLLGRMLGASVTAELLHRADCPVLVAPEPRRPAGAHARTRRLIEEIER
jgi:nucleotide-binding universal stress UspA family protein